MSFSVHDGSNKFLTYVADKWKSSIKEYIKQKPSLDVVDIQMNQGNVFHCYHILLTLVRMNLVHVFRRYGSTAQVQKNVALGAITSMVNFVAIFLGRHYPDYMSNNYMMALRPLQTSEKEPRPMNMVGEVWIENFVRHLKAFLIEEVNQRSFTYKQLALAVLDIFATENHVQHFDTCSHGFAIINRGQIPTSDLIHTQATLQKTLQYFKSVSAQFCSIQCPFTNKEDPFPLPLQDEKVQVTPEERKSKHYLVRGEIICFRHQRELADHEWETITFDSCKFEGETKWTHHFKTKNNTLRRLTFKNMHTVRLNLWHQETTRNLTHLELENCVTLSGSCDLQGLTSLIVHECDPNITLMLKASGHNLKTLQVDKDCQIKHFMHKTQIQELRLINCTSKFIYKCLHSTKTHTSLHKTLKTLAISWCIHQPKMSAKQLHLNRFEALETLILRNYKADSICTRNEIPRIKNVQFYTRNEQNVSAILHKFTHPSAVKRIYVEMHTNGHCGKTLTPMRNW